MNYKDMQLVILMAGKGSRLYPLTLGFPKSLLSIKQKPAVYNMILPLIKEGLRNIIIVVNMENKQLIQDFFDNSFKNKEIKFNYVIQDNFDGPAGAFKLTEKYIESPTILLLGDTLCKYPKNYDESWIGVSKVKKEEKFRFCMIESNDKGIITNIFDKPTEEVMTDDAAVGIYYFKNYKLLKKVLKKNIDKKHNEYQLSSLFELYMQEEQIKAIKIDDWEDIGTLETYVNASKNNFNCRNFNSLYLDELGVIHKRSIFEKITSEMNWFNEIINTDFEKLSPKFYENNKFNTEYGIEYYDYLTLAEYITFYPLNEYSKKIIFSSVFNKLINIYEKNKIVSLEFHDLFKIMLIDKTRKRILKWDRNDLTSKEKVMINGKEYDGLFILMNKLLPAIENICKDTINYVSIIHGDVAFSNILVSPKSMIFKVIDPRGNFGIDTMYGDYRYDLAKLRHCYHGRYDEVINDLFDIKEKSGKLDLQFYKDIDYKIFDDCLAERNVNIDDIELIEALLFISMIPLHSDYPERQLAFFCQGIRFLSNQVRKRGL
mgnify:CR=1 FL=1